MKFRRCLALLVLAFGCTPSPGGGTPPDDGGGANDPDARTGGGVVDAGEPGAPDVQLVLNGTPPVTPKPAIDFTVTNRDGSTRTKDDLLGHPTVIWFYPAAFTSG